MWLRVFWALWSGLIGLMDQTHRVDRVHLMKKLPLCLIVCVLVTSLFSQNEAPKAVAPAASGQGAPAASSVHASSARVSAPLVLKDGAISQLQQTELAEGGRAVFSFTVDQADNYVISAMVNAPAEDANSFFLNIDAEPDAPLMIWDMDVTNGFEERIVSWRGKGDASDDEFKPKVFKLQAGEHKLILVGREPMHLKSVSIRPFRAAPAQGVSTGKANR